ncbi:MAG: hypothetical protein MHPSP_003916, partial [Paramarteilia canceri]
YQGFKQFGEANLFLVKYFNEAGNTSELKTYLNNCLQCSETRAEAVKLMDELEISPI